MELLSEIGEKLSKEFLFLAIESAFNHIIITDTEGKIIYANPAVQRITGYTLDEIIGQTPSVWGKQMPAEFYKNMWSTIKEAKIPFESEVTNKRKGGELYIAHSVISPILDKDKNIIGYLGTEEDITKLKEVDRMKTEFISLASHQLRTPLSAIKWFSEMLLNGDAGQLNEKQNRMTNNVYESNERMIEMVDLLLNISRIESGKITPQIKSTDIVKLIDGVLTDLAEKVNAKHQNIEKSVSLSNTTINIDPNLIRQVFINLISNAVKYTDNEGSIKIEAVEDGNNTKVIISDNGHGIPEKDKERIFSKFFRADNAARSDPDGNGLGLYLVKAIVNSCGGKIWFESEENKGTKFYFTLPMS